MAIAITGSYASASYYSATVSGISSTATRYYYVFTADVSSYGSVQGYVCRAVNYGSNANKSYGSYQTSSTYSIYDRPIILASWTTSTKFSVGTTYSYSSISSASIMSEYTITGWYYGLTVTPSTGVSSLYGYWSNNTGSYEYIRNGSPVTHRFSSSGGYFYIHSIDYATSPKVYSYPVYENFSTTIIDSSGTWQTSHKTRTANSLKSNVGSVITATEQTSKTYYGKLHYDANNGSGAPSDSSVASGTSTEGSAGVSITCSTGEPTRSGYNFLGWADSDSATTPDYYGGNRVTFTAKSTDSSSPTVKTLYAVWQRVYTHYIKKYSQGSLVNTQSTQTTTENARMTIGDYTPTRSGYNFLGWDKYSSASTVWYENGDDLIVGTEFNLYAVWEAQPIYYSYELEIVDGFGATCDTFTAYTTATSKSWTVPSYSSSYPSHNGYVFKYWKYYQAIYYPNETITLYYNDPTGILTAQWNVDTDTFYLQLGTITSSSITVRITGLTAKSYARTVDFVCNGVTKTVTVSANSTSSSYVTFTGLSSEGGYEIDATLKVDSLTLGSNYIDAYPLLNFAWTNIIAQGYPISNLTASDWNEYNRLLTIKAIRHNKTHSYTTVSTGTIIYATYYNAVCNSLRNINSNYNINNVASGDQVIATPFNTMVTYLNTDDN